MPFSASTYALAKKYTDKAVEGLGAIKGADCRVDSVTPTTDGNKVTLSWTGTGGTVETTSFEVKNGVSIVGTTVDSDNKLIVTLSDGSEINAGTIKTAKGDKGDKGFSPIIQENENNTSDVYKLDIITEDGVITTPNLKGESTGASDWSEIKNKPFDTLSDDFEVDENNQLKLSVKPTASEIYIGTTEPTDENYKLWINPDENVDIEKSTADEIYIGTEEPKDKNYKLWINPNENIDSGEGTSWSELKNKPFEKLGNDFTVSEDGILNIKYSKDNSELARTVEDVITENLETENIDFSDF